MKKFLLLLLVFVISGCAVMNPFGSGKKKKKATTTELFEYQAQKLA